MGGGRGAEMVNGGTFWSVHPSTGVVLEEKCPQPHYGVSMRNKRVHLADGRVIELVCRVALLPPAP